MTPGGGGTRSNAQPTRDGAVRGTQPAFLRYSPMRARRIARSSMIERVAYDEAASILCIWFRETGKYLYFDVPHEIYEDLCRAPSPGAFFNSAIKDRFRCQRDPAVRRFGPNA